MSAAATLDFSQSVPVPSTPPQPDYGGVKPVHPAQLDFSKAVPLENDPDPGYAINDVGNKVIVPKEGEQFQDTINRAVTHWKSLSSEDQQKQMNAEIATMPEKVPEALTGAAIAGIAGPAALAAPGEIAGGVRAAVSAPLGGTAPIVRALPHIARLANVLYKLGITTAAAKMLLDEFMPDEHKK